MAVSLFRLIVVSAVASVVLPHTTALDILDIEQPIKPSLTLIDPPPELLLVRGQNASLPCSYTASPRSTARVTWFFNNAPIDRNDTRWRLLKDSTLFFPRIGAGKKVGRSLAGEYRCQVRNGAGVLVSGVAKVKIAAIDKEINQSFMNLTTPENQPFLLPCNVRSTPQAKIHWEFKNEFNYLPLPHDIRNVPLPNGALLISKAQIENTGSYRCIAENTILNKIKYSKEISVEVLPQLQDSADIPLEFLPLDVPLDVTTLLGNDVQFVCAVRGWPMAKIQWLNNDGIVIYNQTVLKIQKSQLKDSGNYTCIAMNSQRRIFQKYSLHVYEKPSFNVTPISTRSPSAKIVRLDCQAKGVPTPRIFWLKDGEPLKIEGRIKKQITGLVLSHTFSYDSGMYQCVAVNSVGRIWTSAEVQIDNPHPPSPPENVQCRTYDGSSICVTWSPPHNVKAQAYTISSYYQDDSKKVLAPEYLTAESSKLCDGLKDSTNYTFYIRVYSSAASDKSEEVTCQTGVTGTRSLDLELVDSTSVLLKWNKLNTDTLCNGTRDIYNISWRQWTEKDEANINFAITKERKYVVNDLLPGNEYQFKITTKSYTKDSPWISFVMPEVELGTARTRHLDNATVATSHQLVPDPPVDLEAVATQPNVVQLKWEPGGNTKYYTVCYVVAKGNGKPCEAGEVLKSFATKVDIPKLETNTLYEFKVRGHNSNGYFGDYSEPIRIRTLLDVPSPVNDLDFKIINASTACIRWRPPTVKNGKILKYVVSYTPESDWLLDEWLQFTVQSQRTKACNVGGDDDVISTYFGNLTEGKQYTVLVRAENNVGLGKPTVPIYVNTAVENDDKPDEGGFIDDSSVNDQQKTGIIIGVILALTCIVCCILCIVLRKRWLKRRTLVQARLAAATNFYAHVGHYGSESGRPVRLEEGCGPRDFHEMERFLIRDAETPHIPPNATGHVDTKGIDYIAPNGSLNGAAKPYANGHVHITENPQFYAFECNGSAKSPVRSHSFEEEDSNSNVKSSKFYDLHRLFEHSKKTKTNSCNPHFAVDDTNVADCDSAGSSDDVRSDGDVTQLTCLDQSALSGAHHRRLSPLLGPNG